VSEVPNYKRPKDPLHAKAYNHKPIGNGKPLMSNGEFKAALEKIDAGDRDLIPELENGYGLDPTQRQLLNNRK
jgi:hypothetical protein